MATARPARFERLVRFERALVRVRWFAIALGALQTALYTPNPGIVMPPSARLFAGAALLLLVVANVVATTGARGIVTERRLRRFGAVVFAMDIVAVYGLVWAFNFEIYGATWVVLAILALEGALRYQLRGAMLPAAITLAVEPVREYVMYVSFDRPFFWTSITFRAAFVGMVGWVAGAMAKELLNERHKAEERAEQLADLAAREAAARRESNAFQSVILSGVSAADLTDALRSMIAHIGSDLGYERIAVLLEGEDRRLHPIATYGFPASVGRTSVAYGEGISGFVAVSGIAEMVPDVASDPRYFMVTSSTRSQISVPIMLSGRVLGVLDVESEHLNAFGESDRSRLERLSAQMALVIEQARLLAQERGTVERLRELDVMKSDFVAIASHELRTPLTAMKGSIGTLRRPEILASPEDMRELLDMLDRQSERLVRLVEDLLVLSRIDAGAVRLRFDAADVIAAVTDAIAELGPAGRRVSLAVPSDIGYVVTDAQRLGQISRNLIENALKFSPDDTTVRVSLHHDGETLCLEVADDGPGIPPDEVPKIFDRFHQVGGSLRRRADGFGLGLYITRRLVNALGGTIEVDSAQSVGSTFRVVLPATAGSAAASGIA